MVTKIMAIHRIGLTNRNHRDASDGDKKKPPNKVSFKKVFAKELSGTAKPPVARE